MQLEHQHLTAGTPDSLHHVVQVKLKLLQKQLHTGNHPLKLQGLVLMGCL